MNTNTVRRRYLDFFTARGAKEVASDSLVPGNDPTLLFTGAGMNQFKDYFLGIGKMDFRRATSCQKCIRTGDIMNVGVTPAHHTMFEMLGNFSFGDYFKREAIEWAWEYLTSELGIAESRLQVSVYESDDEAFTLWRELIGLPEAKINRLGDHDNFWPADAPKNGPNGPCGPCSEIFFDRGAAYGEDRGITEGHRWVEIWNLVFTQFDRQADGTLDPLPQTNIDTGMGLERMAACMQEAPTNMDIDIFQPIVQAIAACAEKKYGDDGEQDTLMRRIADHARAVTFCIGDGVLPSNVHRGYVLKRLLRRAVVDGRSLGIREAFLHTLVPVVAEAMAEPYPDVLAGATTIAASVRGEEDKFLSTLERGLTMIDMAVRSTREAGESVLPGSAAFELYDTYGFPYELAEEVVEREGLTIDRAGFDEAMEVARQQARAGAKMKGDVFAKGPITDVKKITGGTTFCGYNNLETAATVLALVVGDALAAAAADEVTVVLDCSSFYGESGGQIGDTGIIIGEGNLVVRITDTQKIDGIFFHVGTVESGTLNVGMRVLCQVDAQRREDIRRNHTVTHLLHAALHEVLGEQAVQKGSYVGPDRMRFDFQHAAALTEDECRRIEHIVNGFILADLPVTTEVMAIDAARELGAMALFGEKYGEAVRVVRAGEFSTELCGGTHISRSALIGQFRLLSEESVGSGVRRIEGVTGGAASRISRAQGEMLARVARELKVAPGEVVERLRDILALERTLRKEVAGLKSEQVKRQLDNLEPQTIGDIQLVALDLGAALGKELATAADIVKRKLGDQGVTVLVGSDGEKVGLVIAVGGGLAPARLKAGDLVKRLAPIIGGGGGGRADMAQAGGREPDKIPALLAAVPETIEASLVRAEA